MRRTTAPKSRRVRGLSATRNQECRAGLIRRPPVFTHRGSKLVSNQASIFFGSTGPPSGVTLNPWKAIFKELWKESGNAWLGSCPTRR